jgi:hypothetical protein
MTTDFNLSKEIEDLPYPESKECPTGIFVGYIHRTAVKEFVRLLKEKALEHDNSEGDDGFRYNPDCNMSFTEIINTLAGKSLVNSSQENKVSFVKDSNFEHFKVFNRGEKGMRNSKLDKEINYLNQEFLIDGNIGWTLNNISMTNVLLLRILKLLEEKKE